MVSRANFAHKFFSLNFLDPFSTSMAFASQSFVSHSFSTSIVEKLDDSNYLHWWQHVKPLIKSHKLQRFVVNPIVLSRYLMEDDQIANHVNSKYKTWEVQNQALLVWLQSSLSKSILSRVLGSNHSYRFGRRFTSISIFTPNRVHASCELRCAQFRLKVNWWMNIFVRSKAL